MKKIAIFASGTGSNFQALAEAIQTGTLHAEICVLVCDRPGASVIEKANVLGVNSFVFNPKQYVVKADFESEIVSLLQGLQVDYIVLAGYMRLIGHTLLHAFKDRIINIHPSLLPSFPGKDAIGQAMEAGVSKTGVTIHYVDEGMDTGPIIAQKEITINIDDSQEDVEQKVHEVEHRFYAETLQQLFQK